MTRSQYIAALAFLLTLPLTAHAQMSEEDRLARCANNKARIDELKQEISAKCYRANGFYTDEDLNIRMLPDDAVEVRSLIVRLEQLAKEHSPDSAREMKRVRARLGYLDAEILELDTGMHVDMFEHVCDRTCAYKLVDRIHRDIRRWQSCAGPRNEEIQHHTANLAALRCDENPGGRWTPDGASDCNGHDVGSSQGKDPDPGMCVRGRTAICWDGTNYVHRYALMPGAWCTYKEGAQSCSDGRNTGLKYVCQ
jgi:hypothetical protein